MSGLNRADIDEIIRLIEASSFDELRLEVGDTKIELRRGGATAGRAGHEAEKAALPVTAAAAAVPTIDKPAVATGDGEDVPAPLLGTFYHAPKPGADPFIKPGDEVAPDTVIGVIEVMKLMNSVTAGIAGIVTEIVAPNGELVEHGETLIRVKQV